MYSIYSKSYFNENIRLSFLLGACTILFVMCLIPSLDAQATWLIPPPHKQIEDGVDITDVRCEKGLELALRPNGVACIKESSAQKLGWKIIPQNNSTSFIRAGILCEESPKQWGTIHPEIASKIEQEKILEPTCENIEFAMLQCPHLGLTLTDKKCVKHPYAIGSMRSNCPFPVAPSIVYEHMEGYVNYWDHMNYPFSYSSYCSGFDFKVTTAEECKLLVNFMYEFTEKHYRLLNYNYSQISNQTTHPYISFDPSRVEPYMRALTIVKYCNDPEVNDHLGEFMPKPKWFSKVR